MHRKKTKKKKHSGKISVLWHRNAQGAVEPQSLYEARRMNETA